MGCLSLTILGGLIEVAGLAIIAIEIGRLQRQEFGQPIFLVRLEACLRRWIRRSHRQTVQLGGIDSAEVVESAQVKVTPAPAVLLEDRVRRLEQVAEDLRRELDETGERLEGRIVGVHDRIGALEAEQGRQQQTHEQARKASVRRQITAQAVGTVFFFFGVVLSVFGNALTC